MGLLNLFSGKAPEAFEKNGDAYCDNREFGWAVIEYEKALARHKKKGGGDQEYRHLLETKICDTQERLARLHIINADELIEAAVYDEAETLFGLAAGLTTDQDLLREIEQKRAHAKGCSKAAEAVVIAPPAHVADDNNDLPADAAEEFRALVGALPEAEQRAYQSYGPHFTTGYVALHQGDFETAATELAKALDQQRGTANLIALELATAELNRSRPDNAYTLLEEFLAEHPESEKTYALMCDILWEKREFATVRELLNGCGDAIAGSVTITILRGETCCKEQKFQEAAEMYRDFLDNRSWDDQIARCLANTYEALAEPEQARDIYAGILSTCQGCGSKPDPFIMQRYAETSFATGDYSTKILEIYLKLNSDDPDNRSHYCRRISEIYRRLDNQVEAERFAALAGG